MKGGYWRSVLLPAGAFLVLLVAGLSSSSDADEPLFTRSAQQLERLWGGVLGCTHPGDGEPRSTFETTFEGGGVPSAVQHDYVECGKRALRNTSSRMLVNTMEDALRQGGVALFGERFRLNTGIGWVWGENVTGDIEALVPILSVEYPDRTGHALFLQPGAIFWSGLEGEDRTDGSLGLVYRLHLTRDVVAGGSVFYDYDFRRGNRRLGLGLDLQSGVLHAAMNYYHPLSDWRQGRTGYVERPLRGADFRLGFAWSRFEINTSLGIWHFEGEEREEERWSPAFEVEAGYRVFPGVFLQGGYGRHDSDGSLGSRWNVGLAFRFSLPELEGAMNYNSMAKPDLWKLVERERRLLYEERVDFAVHLSVEEEIIAEPGSPGGRPAMSRITGVISGRDIKEDETLEVVVVRDSTTAQYGEASDNDFTFSQRLYGVDVQTGERITPTGNAICTVSPCRMGIPAGLRATNIEIDVEAVDDSNFQEVPEFVDMRVDVRDGSSNLVHSSNVARVTIRGHGNTVGFAPGSDEDLRENGGLAVVTVDVTLPSLVPMVLQVGTTGTAERGTDYRVPASLVIPAGVGSATLTLTGIDNDNPEGNKTITLALSGSLPEGWQYAASTHEITLLDDDLNIGFTGAGNPTLVGENDGTVEFRVAANQPLPAPAVVAWSVELGDGATSGDFSGPTSGTLSFQQNDDRDDPGTIALTLNNDTDPEGAEQVTITLNEAGSSLPPGWSLGGGHTFTIDSNDGAIAFADSSTPLTINEGEVRTVRVNSTVEGPRDGYPLRVSFSPSASGQISFPEFFRLHAGRDTAAFNITVEPDDIPEETVSYTMSLGHGRADPAGWTALSTREVIVPFSDGRISFADASITAEEGGSSVTTTLVMNPPPASNTTIPMTVTGDAQEGTDYIRTLSANGSNVDYQGGVVYPANAASVTFRISAVEDGDEVGERATYRIASFPAGYSAGANTSLQVVLNDNDIGDVQFAAGLDSSANEGERVTLLVQSSTAATADLNLTWSVSPSSEVNSPSSGTVTVRRGSSNATFGITIADPGTDDPEDAEDVVVTLAASNLPAGWSLGERATHTVNIPANDRNITFSPAAATVLESTGHYDLTLSLNDVSTVALPIRITAPPGLSVASPDVPGNWDAGSRTYTIPANSGRSAKVRLDFPEDATYDDITYRIAFSEGGNFSSTAGRAGWNLASTSFTLSVHDPEDSTVGFATGLPTTINEGETIRLGVAVAGGAPGVALPVDWSVPDPQGDLGAGSGRVTIPSAGTSADIEIPIVGGDGREYAESFTVTLDGANLPPGFGLGTRTSHAFTINANENTITFGAPSAARINEGGSATITATINQQIPAGTTPAIVTVTPSGAGGGSAAVRNVDYTLSVSHGTLSGNRWTLPTGRGSAALTITTMGTDSITVDRSFTLDFAGETLPTGWNVTDTSRNITIVNDDAPPSSTIQFSSPTSSATEGTPHTIGFTVQNAGTFTPFNVTVTATGDTHNDDIRASNTVSINTAQNPVWSINIHDSDLIGNERTINLTLTAPSVGGLGAQTTHTLTVTPDGDTGTVAFAQGTSSVGEPADADGTITHDVPLTISRVPANPFNLVIEGAGEGGDAKFGPSASDDANADSTVSVSSATISGTTLNIPVTIRADSDPEIDEVIVLTIPSGRHGLPPGLFSLGSQLTHRITIPANDNTVAFTSSTGSIAEQNTTSFNITLGINQPLPAGTVASVDLTPSGTAASNDYTRSPASGNNGSISGDTWTL
ncbi:MAG: inverse autotransporter beta domain-containing protein, partial [Hyphomicrobiales bacterium]|nr:inverse autotransporter beta domain-containing protein [Hyphomicrobiales bacterium]